MIFLIALGLNLFLSIMLAFISSISAGPIAIISFIAVAGVFAYIYHLEN